MDCMTKSIISGNQSSYILMTVGEMLCMDEVDSLVCVQCTMSHSSHVPDLLAQELLLL